MASKTTKSKIPKARPRSVARDDGEMETNDTHATTASDVVSKNGADRMGAVAGMGSRSEEPAAVSAQNAPGTNHSNHDEDQDIPARQGPRTRATTLREASAALSTGTSRGPTQSEADVEATLDADRNPRDHTARAHSDATEPQDPAEKTYKIVSDMFSTQVETLCDQFDQIADAIDRQQKEQEKRRSNALKVALDTQREAIAQLAGEVQERLEGIRKGKYVVPDETGSAVPDKERLRFTPLLRSPRTTVEAVEEYLDTGDVNGVSARIAKEKRRSRQATVEDCPEDDYRDATARGEPQRQPPPAPTRVVRVQHGLDSEERLRRANLPVGGRSESISQHVSDARAPSEVSDFDTDYDGPEASHPAPASTTPNTRAAAGHTTAPHAANGPTGPAVSFAYPSISAMGHASATVPPSVPYRQQPTHGNPAPASSASTPGRGARQASMPVDPYLQGNLDKITEHIDRMLGRARPGTPPKSAVKPSPPEPYSGRNDHEVFNVWLSRITSYFRLAYLCGPDYDEDRLLHTNNLLSGEAQEWWTEQIVNDHFHGRRSWVFVDAVCAMYARFVRQGSSQNAAMSFWRAQYLRSRGGATQFYNRLCKYANRMIVHPDEYTMSTKFYDGLPRDIASSLARIYGLRPETASIEQLLAGALIIEDNDDYLEQREKVADSRRGQSTQATRPTSARPAAAAVKTDGRDRNSVTPRPRPAVVSSDSPKPAQEPHVSTARAPAHAARPRGADQKKVQCFRCKGTGHYSNDPTCPMYVKPALRMMSTAVDGTAGDSVPDDIQLAQQDTIELLGTDEEPSASLPDVAPVATIDSDEDQLVGSQYDSECDDEYYSDAYGYQSADEGSERLYSLRVVPLEDADDDIPTLVPTRRASSPSIPPAGPSDYDPEMPPLIALSDSDYDSMDESDEDSDDDSGDTPDDPRHASRQPSRDTSETEATTQDLRDEATAFANLFTNIHVFDDDHLVVPADSSPSAPGPSVDDLQAQLDAVRADLALIRAAVLNDAPRSYLTHVILNATLRDATWRAEDPSGQSEREWLSDVDRLHQSLHERPTESPRVMTMRPAPADRGYRTAMRSTGTAQPRPALTDRCLTIHVTINGLKALALIDTGSTVNCVSPDFARVAKVPIFELTNPIGLQLGCVGSRSRINFGTRVPVKVADSTASVYFDVVNVDHYDVILGVPILKQLGARLDFASCTVVVGSTNVPVIVPDVPNRREQRDSAPTPSDTPDAGPRGTRPE